MSKPAKFQHISNSSGLTLTEICKEYPETVANTISKISINFSENMEKINKLPRYASFGDGDMCSVLNNTNCEKYIKWNELLKIIEDLKNIKQTLNLQR